MFSGNLGKTVAYAYLPVLGLQIVPTRCCWFLRSRPDLAACE